MAQPVSSMTNRTLSGLFWTSLATGANVVSLLLVLIVLARLVSPADFGLAAAALMVIGFSAIFADFGVGPAVVQRSELRTAHISSAFTLSIFLGILFGAATWLLAPATAEFFQLPDLDPILRVLCVIFPVQALGVVADSLLQRELRFRTLAILDVITFAIGYGVVGITLAVSEFGAWSLLGAHLTQMSLRTVLLIAIRPHPLWPLLEYRACVDLLNFGGGFTASRFSNYLAGQAEHLVIGRYLGPVALGVYGRAYQLMAGPAVLFGNVLDRVLFPTMVHMQHQPKRLAVAYRRGVALIALVMLPLSVIVVALAPEVVHLLLGPHWDAVIFPLQILSVGMMFRTSCKISDALVRAAGAVYRRTWRQTAYAIVVLVGALIGQLWGVEGVAIAVLATLALNFMLMAQLALSLTDLPWRIFAAVHLPGLALGAATGIPVTLVANALRSAGLAPFWVVLCSLIAAVPALLAVVLMPRVFLGRDGRWMARKAIDLVVRLRSRRHLPAINPSAAAGLPLATLRERLAAAGIRYCRWKSRVDMSRLLSGAGDLDLLVHRADRERFLGVAEEIGFTRVVPCFESASSQEVHLYGPDHETGALLHLHVNFALFDAELDFSPSLEDRVLQTCTQDEASGVLHGMPVVRPEAELLVFVLRSMEESADWRAFPRVLRTAERQRTKLLALLAADSQERWRILAETWLPADARPLFAEYLAELRQPASWLHRLRLARRLHRSIALPSQRSAVERVGLWTRIRRLAKRVLHGGGSPKQLPGGGLVIAFVGPDASGKSTMVTECATWLGQVFRVKTAHLGKPPSTWLTWIPNAAGRLLGRLAPRMRTFHQRPVTAGSGAGGQGLLYHIRAVLLAWDRRALALRLGRLAADGWIVVCDRYPTATVGGPDSARLQTPDATARQSRLRAYLARLENRLYRDIPDPSIVVRLSSPLGLALDRNRDRVKAGKEGDDFIARRHGDFFMPSFGNARIVVLDTSTSRLESVRMMRRQTWERLGRTATMEAAAPTETPRFGLVNDTDDAPKPKSTLVVEFIGVSGVGKSTLIAAVVRTLGERGLRVGLAEEVILARHGLAFPHHPRVGSAFTFALSLWPFCGFFCTRSGAELTRLAFHSIVRGMANFWVGASLLRNYIKRVGSHLLLEEMRGNLRDHDIIIWDEGVVHAAHNLFVHHDTAPRLEEVERFGHIVPKPELLVWVTAPTAQSARVMLERGHSRISRTSPAAAAFAAHGQTTFEVLAGVPELRERLHRVDNSARDADRTDAEIRARAGAVSAFLIEELRRPQEAMPMKGASLCLIA